MPAWVASLSLGLLVIVFLQAGLVYRRYYWLHVPIGVGMFDADATNEQAGHIVADE